MTETVGDLMRHWRRARRMSQLDLSLEAEVSTRHLSFVESGRAQASRDMLRRLSERLALPLRERNRLLIAGGYAPDHGERPLDAPEMSAALDAVREMLAAHPFPAVAVDRRWTLQLANPAAMRLLAGLPGRLLAAPVNVLRATLDPEGLAPHIVNLPQWRRHLLDRLQAEFVATGDPAIARLFEELSALPLQRNRSAPVPASPVAVPLVLRFPQGPTLSLISTTTVFGTANDVTLQELTLETFYPADAATRDHFLRQDAEA